MPDKMRQTLKHETGDARYLDQIQKCLAAARALLGLADARKSSAAADGPPRVLTAAQLIQAIVFNDRFHAGPDCTLTEADAPLFPDPQDNAAFEAAYAAAATAASQGKVVDTFDET